MKVQLDLIRLIKDSVFMANTFLTDLFLENNQ